MNKTLSFDVERISRLTNNKTKFLWCPVCMCHLEHNETLGGWKCTGPYHKILLETRNDEWIKKYKEKNVDIKVLSQ